MSNIKGELGEDRVSFLLGRLDKNNYKVANNLIMLDSEGVSFNIDHIVISTYGLFVIETKNLSGSIYGSEYDKVWYQRKGIKEIEINNPIHQNYGHVQKLKSILNNNIPVISIICLTERADIHVDSRHTKVVTPLKLPELIMSYRNKVFNLEQVRYLVDKVRMEVTRYKQSKMSHIGYVTFENRRKYKGYINKALLDYVDRQLNEFRRR